MVAYTICLKQENITESARGFFRKQEAVILVTGSKNKSGKKRADLSIYLSIYGINWISFIPNGIFISTILIVLSTYKSTWNELFICYKVNWIALKILIIFQQIVHFPIKTNYFKGIFITLINNCLKELVYLTVTQTTSSCQPNQNLIMHKSENHKNPSLTCLKRHEICYVYIIFYVCSASLQLLLFFYRSVLIESILLFLTLRMTELNIVT